MYICIHLYSYIHTYIYIYYLCYPPGIIPRALSRVFSHVASTAGEIEHTVRISYLEIYNQAGFDLLGETSSGQTAHSEGGFALPRISGVTEVRLKYQFIAATAGTPSRQSVAD